MKTTDARIADVHVELVTTTFVASGRPEGVYDLGRFLENLNNPALSRQIELRDASVRPLYNATAGADLDAPLLVRRDDIVFATFDGPYITRGTVKPPSIDVPVLLMAPPFQVQGNVEIAPDIDTTQALRGLIQPFFCVKDARVYDADGIALGEGEQIVMNATAVQMRAATRRFIEAAPAVPMRRREMEEAYEMDERPERAARAA